MSEEHRTVLEANEAMELAAYLRTQIGVNLTEVVAAYRYARTRWEAASAASADERIAAHAQLNIDACDSCIAEIQSGAA